MAEKLTIQNQYLKVDINRIGAELCSIVSKKSHTEYMWQGDPSIWASTAPVLFPIIGCLKNEVFKFQGGSYSVPKHGFIRHNETLKSTQLNEQGVEFQLAYSPKSLIYYPFRFEFKIRFELLNNQIQVSHEVINHDQKEAMYFSLGGHPAFNCPINYEGAYSEYFLEFEHLETCESHEVLPSGLIGQNTFPLLDNSNTINLHPKIFEKDALILKNLVSRKVTLKSKASKKSIEIEFKDFPYLGLWAKPGAPFVCIEPWLGISDNFDTTGDIKQKEGIIELAPQDTFRANYTISILE